MNKKAYPVAIAAIVVIGLLWYLHASSGVKPATVGTSSIASTPSNGSTATNSTPVATAPAASSSNLSDGTHTGQSYSNEYGDVQVAITVTGGKISNVNVLKYPTAHDRSVQINSDAVPRLKQEALTAQSASIDIISGATSTSESFIQSLQSALSA